MIGYDLLLEETRSGTSEMSAQCRHSICWDETIRRYILRSYLTIMRERLSELHSYLLGRLLAFLAIVALRLDELSHEMMRLAFNVDCLRMMIPVAAFPLRFILNRNDSFAY